MRIYAVYGACAVVRQCAHIAFQKHKRSTLTSDMLHEIGKALEMLEESDDFI